MVTKRLLKESLSSWNTSAVSLASSWVLDVYKRQAQWYKYVGLDGAVIGLDRYGASAPAGLLFEKFGFTAQHAAQVGRELLAK